MSNRIANAASTAPTVPTVPTAKEVKSQMEAMASELKALKVQLAKAKAAEAGPKGLSLKVSQKGAISVYGLGRFPVTLYKGQWERLLDEAEAIKAFAEAHASELSAGKAKE